MVDINSDDYYKNLGLDKGATDSQIKRAYKKLAMQYHPDKNKEPGADEKFKKINEAYSILSDSEKRHQYDQFGKVGINNNIDMSNFQANEVFSQFFGGNDPFGNHEDIFNIFLNMNQNQSQFNGFSGNFQNQGFPFANFGSNNFRTNSTRSRKQPENTIKKGVLVLLKNLQNNNLLNGLKGIVEKYDIQNDRYFVQVNNHDLLSLKFENLLQLATCTICNLQKKPELNNKKGQIVNYNISKKRYLIEIENQQMYFKLDNLIIDKDYCVKLNNISSQPMLNGKIGKIITYDKYVDRYIIVVDCNRKLKVKKENIEI